ncbi:response regulator [Ekhidna sp.]|uniref:response regulator n=1 Tax=Ekhidna sp. TaxID=2608089 RepID=UPI0032F04F92
MSDQYDRAILCIDDEKIILDSLKSQINEEFNSSFKIELAESAEEGYEIIDELFGNGIRLLIIVSDWLMPNIKGDEFLANVHVKYPGIVKIMLTGQADQTAMDNAFKKAGLYKIIHKPWSKDELIDSIKEGIKLSN